jgi:hypothetical protein
MTLNVFGEEINHLLPPGIEPRFLGYAAHSLVANNAEPFLLLIIGRNG